MKTFNLSLIFNCFHMIVPFLKSNKGISSLTSVLLILALIVLVSGLLFFYLSPMFEFGISDPSSPVIRVESFSGGSRYADSTRFQDNVLVLRHAGGPPLLLESVSVQLTGKGNSYKGFPGSGGEMIFGDVCVSYEHLGADKKNSQYQKNNAGTLIDGYWSSGEILILTGNDSYNTTHSSVLTSVGSETATSNNYGFSTNTDVEIIVFRLDQNGSKQIIMKKTQKVLKK